MEGGEAVQLICMTSSNMTQLCMSMMQGCIVYVIHKVIKRVEGGSSLCLCLWKTMESYGYGLYYNHN